MTANFSWKIESLVSLTKSTLNRSNNWIKAFLPGGYAVLVASITITGIIIGAREAKILQPLELDTYDRMVRLQPLSSPNPRLLIVKITEDDIRNQKQWPLSDQTLAQLLESLQRHQPKVIGLDIFRDIPHNPGHDKLTKQLQADNVIVVEKLMDEDGSSVPPPPGFPLDRVGFADLLVDFDNVVRRNLLYAVDKTQKQEFYSFALRISLKYLASEQLPFKVNPKSLQIGSKVFPDLEKDAGGYKMSPKETAGWQTLLKYHAVNPIAPEVTLTDVLNGKVDPNLIKDKIVLIGTTAPTGKDLFATPYSDGESQEYFMPGVVIHAQMIDQILDTVLNNETQFWFFPEWGEWLWVWGWSFLGGLIVYRLNRALYLIVVELIAIGVLWGVSLLFFIYSGWVPMIAPMIGLVGTGTAILGHKFFFNLFHDSLTKLPNRRLFIKKIQQVKRNKKQKSEKFAVLFLALDRFKMVNEGLGHEAGDYLLVSTAERLQEQLNGQGYLARVGGDEFAICLNSIQNIQQANQIAKNIQINLKDHPFFWDDQEIYATVSIGITLNKIGVDSSPDELLLNAYTAMYEAKKSGRVTCEIFDSEMREQVVNRWQLEMDLRRALKNQELQLFYQAIVSLRTGKIAGFEALVRWKCPKRGLVSPGIFIPIAEETGLIVPMGQWILQEACRQMSIWHEQFPQNPPLMISVNLSSRQFTQPDLVQQIQHVLDEIHLERKSLKLEITESMMMNDVESAIDLLKRLKNLGLRLSIDDFGTGYSNLSYLHRFPIDTLKVDQSFVRRMNEGEDHDKYSQIVRTVILLGHNLELDIIAEGIETEEQMEILRSLNCEYGQGYFFSKPIPSQEATDLLAKSPQW